MPDFIVNSLPAIVIMLIATLIGAIAYRRNNTKQLRDIQNQVIETYKAQNEVQEKQIVSCEKEIARLKRIVATIEIALKRRGLRIEIDADSITLIDTQAKGARTTTMKIKVDSIHDADGILDVEDKEDAL